MTGRKLPDVGIMAALAALTVAVRLLALAHSGGLAVMMGYDDGVYFAATNGLLHGLMPYRDFVLLHPPGILLVGAGPVWWGHALGLDDSGTLALVRLVFLGLGVVNTVLVFVAGRHLSRATGVIAACLYAVWLPVIREERTLLLEPVVAVGLLSALALIPPTSRRSTAGWWRPMVAGVVGGLAVATKLWAVVPLLVIVGALLVVRRWRTALAYTACAALASVAVVAPFAAAAPGRMWAMVVADQAGRPAQPGGTWVRIGETLNLLASPLRMLLGPDPVPGNPSRLITTTAVQAAFLSTGRAHLVMAAAVILIAALGLLVAWRVPAARVWVVLLGVQALVLSAVPTFFGGYPSYVAPALVLTLAAAAHQAWGASALRLRPRVRTGLAVGLVASLVLLGAGAMTTPLGRRPNHRVAPLVATSGCLASDSPIYLALTNRLSANLDHGCPAVFDFSGTVYTVGYPRQGPAKESALRRGSPAFQQFAASYFAASDHVILRRRHVDGLTRGTLATLDQRPLVHAGFPLVFGPAASPTAITGQAAPG